ncbi:transcriptional regulator, AraC family [Pseudonocardia ammonioxydans]|uniref:Transcriptional regulator, AraC family n=1 Tax=Pseudonocardia ammonioxydans TaxID=260086 RepID=A0A1I5FHA0_PSUAM|nr:AraC family transcriptional regulator [Pseudonocardia ammonioxydans]SFO22966.1 transcriptional regulator, AraC family [Pseudonocardia ammonioxydans]
MATRAPDPGAARTGSELDVLVSTEGVSARRAPTVWGDAINSQYCEMDLQVLGRRDTFDGLLHAVPVGRLDFSRMRSSPHRVVRTPAMIRSDDRSEILLCMVTRGVAEVQQNGRTCTVEGGALTLVDCDSPFLFALPEDFEQVIVRIPRRQLLACLPERAVAGATARTLTTHTGMGSVLGAFIRQVLVLDDDSLQRSAGTLAASTLNLLSEALAAEPGGAVTPAEAARRHDLQRAKDALRDNLHDAEHTMDDLCRDLGVSRRYLQTLFRDGGSTPSGWLREARMERARQLLRTTDLTTEAVAERCGFKDYSHFHRTFKAHSGRAPGAFRRGGDG